MKKIISLLHSESEWKKVSSFSYSRRQLFILISTIGFAYLITTPPIYRYAISNQTVHLPIVEHVLNPSYLANDWYVNSAGGFDSPRYFYTRTIALISQLVGLPTAVFILYISATVATIIGLWTLIYEIFNDKLVATIAVGITLAHLTAGLPAPDLGGNSLIGSYLDPDKIANPILIVGLIYSIREEYTKGFFFFGLGTLFHVVNGFWIALATGISVAAVEAWPNLREKNYKQSIINVPWHSALIYGIISSVVIIPLYMANFTSEVSETAVYIDAWIRHPHHKILTSWNPWLTAATIGAVVVGCFLLFYFRFVLIPNKQKRQFIIVYTLSLLSIMFLGGYIFVEVIYVPSITQLQAFRIDSFIYVVLYGVLAKLTVFILHRCGYKMNIKPGTFVISMLCIIIILATVGWGIPFAVAHQGSNQSLSEIYIQTPSHGEDLENSYAWIQSNTPRDSVVLAPPSESGVRLATSRAIVVNIKSFPFRHDAILEWEERLNTVCDMNVREHEGNVSSIVQSCEENYHNLTESEIKYISKTYRADYAISKNSSYNFPIEEKFGNYTIYRINTSTVG